MQWNMWSGFTGEGTYVIFNKESLTCLNLEEGSKQPDTKVQCLLVIERLIGPLTLTFGSAHSPNDWAQQWRIRKPNEADVYYIECAVSATVLTASGIAGPDKFVVGMPKVEHKLGSVRYNIPTEALWVIDKSIYGLEPGKMVV
ncbi:MAG: hypothetical protein L6R42_004553 [Xanthoria sp. 1 TBL-2021]|nr:MAG: hypothetical protein L6R42_004553 [Xanthoria sp. 1 TBL-2021]